MANKRSRPGRTLIVFGLVILAMYGAIALKGDWTPKLGLDLQGGTRITLEASTDTGEDITQEKLDEAAAIIDSRVNAQGVAETEVSTSGNRNIVVEVPGQNQTELVDTVQQTAQLRFRLVAAQATGTPGEPTPSESPQPDATEGDQKQKKKQGKKGDATEPSASPDGRALSQGLVRADETPAPSQTPAGTPAPAGSEAPEQQEVVPEPAAEVPTNKSSVADLIAWARNPDAKSQRQFAAFSCGGDNETVDNPARPVVACDEEGVKYLLSPAAIEGTQLDDASSGIPDGEVQYAVFLDFDGEATDVFADVTRAYAGTNEQFAIVLDGEVLSAPVVTTPITDGRAQISGDFDAEGARSLANSLKYGALPLKFEVQEVSEEGPSLASDQLSAGLWAGGVGLALVLVYCMAYYRGLGIVVVASLGVAGAVTYAAVLFLSANAGFTLTLPGIAGLIVAVGITADSFIVYFERIRDEMREGKSVRVAVESGWDRAKMTCLAADAVSLLAAVVLYIFAIGVVKGFAFALGISTVIDVLVFFLFTKPMVTWLARFKFFSTGHTMSGLSAEHAGIDRIGVPARPVQPAGGMVR
jgi:preprotein translocase subunit SecD